MQTAKLANVAIGAALTIVSLPANAGLYTNNFGSLVPGYAVNDDSTFGPVTLPFTVNYFGTNYNETTVSNNGNIQFGTNSGAFSPSPLNTTTALRAIAPYWTDLDSRADPLGPIAANSGGSGVYVRQVSASEVVFTWDRLGFFSQDYTGGRVQFQLVLRDPAAVIPTGQGSIGFFYGALGALSGYDVAVGFGDGQLAVNAGEISTFSGTTVAAATALGAIGNAWFSLTNGVPIVIPGPTPGGNVAEPGSLALLGLALLGVAGLRRTYS